MDIKTLKVVEHRGCKIYIRNFNSTFEYLTIIKGELFTTHMVITPSLLRRWSKDKYTSEQLTAITKQLMLIAETTIDTVLDSKK
jgi:hypothetical protein